MKRTKTQTIIELNEAIRQHQREEVATVQTSLLTDALCLIIQGLQEIKPSYEAALDEKIIFEGDNNE